MPKKRGGSKKLKPVLHIFCEGEKTEPNYINGYVQNRHPTNRLLKVIKVEKTKKNTPVQLVQEAIKLKNDKSTPDEDICWVVYDREAVSKYTDKLHQESLDKARSKNINVALTNVCFEVWLILHFSELTASYSSFSDLIKNSILKDELKKIGVDDYDKADRDLFDLIVDKIPEARKRAVNMNQATLASSYDTEDKSYLLNPYTGMHNLLDAIDEFVAES
jgi:hypothetical protein